MSNATDFRTPEQEVLKLLEECAEIRRALKSISGQLARMETRVKHAFPAVAQASRERASRNLRSSAASITPQEALAEFDKVAGLAASGAIEEAERILEAKTGPDLLVIAKEVGVSFSKSKPSIRAMRKAIFGKVRESVLLSRHNPRS
jgi:hypothetical protein